MIVINTDDQFWGNCLFIIFIRQCLDISGPRFREETTINSVRCPNVWMFDSRLFMGCVLWSCLSHVTIIWGEITLSLRLFRHDVPTYWNLQLRKVTTCTSAVTPKLFKSCIIYLFNHLLYCSNTTKPIKKRSHLNTKRIHPTLLKIREWHVHLWQVYYL